MVFTGDDTFSYSNASSPILNPSYYEAKALRNDMSSQNVGKKIQWLLDIINNFCLSLDTFFSKYHSLLELNDCV